jgi:diadenosine tetraphosphate (Ap4A) HIT family hydrolase
MFALDPAFLATSRGLMALPLCDARLQLDARFPWIVLIPRVDAAAELEDLDAYARRQLMDEILAAGRAVRGIGVALGRPVQKLNVGQLGNITRQLHVHVVGRRADDPCWPGPVWGQGVAMPYAPESLEIASAAALAALSSAAA